MNQDTVATSMAKKLGIQKSDLLDIESGNLAVKMAQSETIIIS
jgi:multiple RNA-binding domain-containing protein 1